VQPDDPEYFVILSMRLRISSAFSMYSCTRRVQNGSSCGFNVVLRRKVGGHVGARSIYFVNFVTFAKRVLKTNENK